MGGGGLRIAVVTDHDSWISSYLDQLVFDFLSGGHHVLYTNSLNALSPGDICFI